MYESKGKINDNNMLIYRFNINNIYEFIFDEYDRKSNGYDRKSKKLREFKF